MTVTPVVSVPSVSMRRPAKHRKFLRPAGGFDDGDDQIVWRAPRRGVVPVIGAVAERSAWRIGTGAQGGERVAVVPGHPLSRVRLEVGGVALELDEVVERIAWCRT